MHPLQQPRVLRGVRPTVGGRALHAPVHDAHGVHGLLGQLGGAVGGGREVGPGALQPAEGVLAVGGVTVHPRHGQRVQGLQVEAADATDERGHRAVDGPDRIAGGEPPGGAGGLGDRAGDVGLAVGPPGQHLAHGRGQRGQEGAGCHGSRVRQPAPARIRARSVGPRAGRHACVPCHDGGMSQPDDIDKLLREIDAMNAGSSQGAALPAPAQNKAIEPAAKSTGGSRSGRLDGCERGRWVAGRRRRRHGPDLPALCEHGIDRRGGSARCRPRGVRQRTAGLVPQGLNVQDRVGFAGSAS